MRTRPMFFGLAAFLFILSMVSCDKEEVEKRITNFNVPELTASNTIQFTVNLEANQYAYVLLDGGKVAVDWGDGTVTKDVNPGSGEAWRGEFTHVYKQGGEYTVKIWSDELTFANIPGVLRDYSGLQVGNCPVLENAVFNTFTRDKTLDLGGCTALKGLNLGNWEQLESVSLAGCTLLDNIFLYTNPLLKTLDLSGNTRLQEFRSDNCGIEELSLPKGIVKVECRKNNLQSLSLQDYTELISLDCSDNRKLSSLNLTGCEKLSILNFSDTKVGAFDFSGLTSLTGIFCSGTGLTAVDVGENEELMVLNCSDLGLTSLDITLNPKLQALYCSDNELTSLDVSHNPLFRHLYIDGNKFDKAGLESVFEALPAFDPSRSRATFPHPAPQNPVIKIFGNPGAADCDTSIITGKGWVLKTE